MRRKTLILVLLAPLIAITASAHDLFLKLDLSCPLTWNR